MNSSVQVPTNPIGSDISSTDAQHDFVGSVIPIGITSDTPDVPGGAPFALTVTLSAPPMQSSTLDVYVAPAAAGGIAPAGVPGTEDVLIHFSNLDVQVHATTPGAPASTAPVHLVVPLLPNQMQQHIHLPASVAPTPGQYVVSVLGHDPRNMPTKGVSIIITVRS